MSKKWLIIAAVVVVAGIVLLLLLGGDDKKSSNNSTTAQTNTQQPTTANKTESGNIYSIADGGNARKCTYTFSSSAGTSTGTMYTDGKGKGLMTTEVKTAKGNTANSNTLVLADKVYGWSDAGGQTVGFVFSKKSLTNSSSSSSSSSAADPDKDFDLNCVNWTVDESMLAVPSDVNFTSIPSSSQ